MVNLALCESGYDKCSGNKANAPPNVIVIDEDDNDEEVDDFCLFL